jgi:NADPH2:quinone reductase
VALFSQMGFHVIAATGKASDQEKRLRQLGAQEVISREKLSLGQRPLEKARFAGAVDNVGGTFLSQILPHIDLWGNVACVGLAESPKLTTTVMPFILRGVCLLGISSANTPYDLRRQIWQRLSDDWKPKDMGSFVEREIGLGSCLSVAEDMLDRKTTGRSLVKIK